MPERKAELLQKKMQRMREKENSRVALAFFKLYLTHDYAFDLLIRGVLRWFPLSRNSYLSVHARKFTLVNKKEAISKVWSIALKREVERRSTFTISRNLSNVTPILFANETFTHVRTT